MSSRWLALVVAAGCSSPSPTKPVAASEDETRTAKSPPDAEPQIAAVDAAIAIETDAAIDAAPRVELAVVHSFGGIDLVESMNSAMFMHGGSPVTIEHASIKFEVRDARSHRIDVSKIAVVVGCKRAKPVKRPLEIVALRLHASDAKGGDPIAFGDASIAIPAGPPQRYRLAVHFKPISATDRECAYDVAMVVDRVPHRAELPLQITRLEAIE